MREPSTTSWALYERDDTRVYWATRTFRGERQRKSTRQVDRALAEAVVLEWNREAVDPLYKASKAVTVGAAVTNFLGSVAQRVAPATLSAYTGQAGHLVRVFGENERLLPSRRRRSTTARSAGPTSSSARCMLTGTPARHVAVDGRAARLRVTIRRRRN